MARIAVLRGAFAALALVGLVATAACNDGFGTPVSDDSPGTPTDDAPGDGGDGDAPGDGDGDGGDESPEPPDPIPPVPPDRTVRFVALGDTGEGNAAQYAVAAAIKSKCDSAGGCDFAVLLGDNFYDDGVDSVDDPQWQEKFEQPYAQLDMPFYPVLGNHDYGGTFVGGLGNEFFKGPVAVDYSARSSKWSMPATFYTFTYENVGFIMLDSNSILWDNKDNGDQEEWYDVALLDVADADWVFVATHHPYRSNGSHGNAGTYESIEVGGRDIPLPIPILNGANFKEFFDDFVCGTVDFSLSGHDHNLQWLDEPDALCGAELIVSGAGAKTKGFDNEMRNGYRYANADTEGFFFVEIDGLRMTGRFYDRTGALLFERTIMK